MTVEEPANLKFLRRLVTTLTAVMIVGVVVLISLVVIRLSGGAPALAVPDVIELPDGAVATAFTQGADWYAVVTEGDTILIYDRASGDLRQQVQIAPAK